jgi:protein-disulfide isomerase
MPLQGGTSGHGKRVSAGPGGGRFSTRARVAAGAAAAALAALAALAAATLAGSGYPAQARAPSGTGGAAATSGGDVNPNSSAHPITGPTPLPAAPALTLGRPTAPVTIVDFGDYQCTSCGAFARDTERR